ncbi:MAG: hypothetical protein IPJ14_09040 [Kineosporiaceae bacterium]|nr:hypothetical protein [Kineosporiaceae bacterium]MBK8078771.1 hypothetical protein [Kineosporiaceae bacterium]
MRNLHGLFHRRVPGDDALLELCRLRFAQSGLAAEIYADSPSGMDHELAFVPSPGSPDRRPLVHLPRHLDLLDDGAVRMVRTMVRHAGDRVAGFVVHDRRHMPARLPELARAGEVLSAELARFGDAWLFLEYAAGNRFDEFTTLARRLASSGRVGVCVDTGHVGVRAARWAFAARRPDLDVDLIALTGTDARLPDLLDDVRAATAQATGAVTRLIRSVATDGTRVHLHLHDGHPLVDGLADHFGFLGRLAVPFEVDGRRSLEPMFGPAGLAEILRTVHQSLGDRASATLEIHQGFGRVGLDAEAAALFGHWGNLTSAEQTNAHLALLSENAELARAVASSALGAAVGSGVGATVRRGSSG